MRLALVRHGETEWNRDGRLQGSSDVRLSATGRADAEVAATALSGTAWELVVSSPLQRAAESAEIIAGALGIRVGPTVELLRERDFGAAEGLTLAEANLRWPEAGIADSVSSAEALGIRFPAGIVPGVEPIDSVRDRGRLALELLGATMQATVVVCHGTLIRCILSDLAGYEVPRVCNGEVVELECFGDSWSVKAAKSKWASETRRPRRPVSQTPRKSGPPG